MAKTPDMTKAQFEKALAARGFKLVFGGAYMEGQIGRTVWSIPTVDDIFGNVRRRASLGYLVTRIEEIEGQGDVMARKVIA